MIYCLPLFVVSAVLKYIVHEATDLQAHLVEWVTVYHLALVTCICIVKNIFRRITDYICLAKWVTEYFKEVRRDGV